MNVKDNFYYVDSSRFDAKILRLPYRGNKYAMYIVVPNSLTGLPRVLNNLSELRTEMIYLQERLVDVILPKFQFEYMSRLEGVLREVYFIELILSIFLYRHTVPDLKFFGGGATLDNAAPTTYIFTFVIIIISWPAGYNLCV
ncbi:hypothetical protein O3G_MSEX000849 [Manduca sexta]|nr:hypothetical protein O3G_MSEX000849 [Manduca sexta]